MANAPSPYLSDEIGNQADSVQLRIGGDTILNAESWTVTDSVMEQPGRWSLRFGFDTIATYNFYLYAPGKTFTLLIGGAPQATGVIEKRELEMKPGSSGTELVVGGRDVLAPLFKATVTAQTSFTNATYSGMVQTVLKAVGLDPSKLVLSNTNNRQIKAGIPITETAPADVIDQLDQQVPGTLGADASVLQAKVGQSWMEFLRLHLDRAGLMLWAGADGTFILSTPNAQQKPSYTLFRNIAQTAGQTNILGWHLVDDTSDRHAEAIIYGRGGGRKAGRAKAKGLFLDQEMLDYGFGQSIVIRDRYVQTGAQAAYLARRKLAEERRQGWQLHYTFAGHTLPRYASRDWASRAVVVPDTVIYVDDNLLGIQGSFYVDTVERTRSEGTGTQTTIRLMRPEDCIFGDIALTAAQASVQTPKPSDFGTFDFSANVATSGNPFGSSATGL